MRTIFFHIFLSLWFIKAWHLLICALPRFWLQRYREFFFFREFSTLNLLSTSTFIYYVSDAFDELLFLFISYSLSNSLILAHLSTYLSKKNFSDLLFSCFLLSGIICIVFDSFLRIQKIFFGSLCSRFLALFDSNE